MCAGDRYPAAAASPAPVPEGSRAPEPASEREERHRGSHQQPDGSFQPGQPAQPTAPELPQAKGHHAQPGKRTGSVQIPT